MRRLASSRLRRSLCAAQIYVDPGRGLDTGALSDNQALPEESAPGRVLWHVLV